MSLDVVGTGFGRTGTLSLKHALEAIGFDRCYHMEEVFRRPSHAKAWQRRAEGGPLDMDLVFDGYRSAVDFPVSAVWREILAAHPAAKIVHTVRDADRWWESTAETIHRTSGLLPRWARWTIRHPGRVVDMADALVWDGLFDGRFLDRSHAIEVYERHTAEVIAEVRADRLLVYRVDQGWEPLCDFLGVEVPSQPFPDLNDRASMQRRMRGLVVMREAARFGLIATAALALRSLNAATRRGPVG